MDPKLIVVGPIHLLNVEPGSVSEDRKDAEGHSLTIVHQADALLLWEEVSREPRRIFSYHR